MKKRWSRVMSLLLLSLILSAVHFPAYAAGAIDTGKDVTLTVSYINSGKEISEAKFDIYKVADVDAYAQMTLTSRFAAYPISITGHDESSWLAIATTLKVYVWKDSITADVSGVTDAAGKMTLTLKPGLYLILSQPKTLGGYVYTTTPYLIFLPGSDTVNNVWDYNVNSYPKSDASKRPSGGGGSSGTGGTAVVFPGEKTSRKVLKIWEDAENEDMRPDEIVIHLMCDGKLVETVTLSEANCWSHEWNNLDRSCDWLVTEDGVSGYTQTVAREGITFVVTNTLKPTEEIEVPDEPGPEIPAEKAILGLPQTGIMWWPILMLFVGGLTLIVIGLIRRRSDENE